MKLRQFKQNCSEINCTDIFQYSKISDEEIFFLKTTPIYKYLNNRFCIISYMRQNKKIKYKLSSPIYFKYLKIFIFIQQYRNVGNSKEFCIVYLFNENLNSLLFSALFEKHIYIIDIFDLEIYAFMKFYNYRFYEGEFNSKLIMILLFFEALDSKCKIRKKIHTKLSN